VKEKSWTLVLKLLLRSKRNERLKDGEGDLSLRVVKQRKPWVLVPLRRDTQRLMKYF
jgi:hypothetical protein